MIKPEKLKEKVRMAEEAVEDIQDEKRKERAFDIILDNLIKAEQKAAHPTLKKEEYRADFSENPKEDLQEEVKFNMGKLVEAIGIQQEKMDHIFDISQDEIHILCPIPGTSGREKIKNATLLILTSYYYCAGKKEYKSGQLQKKLQDLGLTGITNMAAYLKGYSHLFIKKGIARSPLTVYRITIPGLQEGVKLIKQLGGVNE